MAMLITALRWWRPRPPRSRRSGCPTYITDDAGALNGSGRAAIQSATGKLYSDRHIQLWVVFVDNFSGQPAVSWAENTRAASDLGDFDALLAVATVDHSYAFLVPNRVQTISAQSGRRSATQPDRTRAAPRRLERRGGRGGQRARPGPASRRTRRRC